MLLDRFVLERLILVVPLQYQIEEQRALFAAPYLDPTNMVTSFINYAEACVDHYRENYQIFNSPYFCLVQSSGYGKSRLLREVARKVRVMYVCMRPETARSTGYPRPSSIPMAALFDNLYTPQISTYVDRLATNIAKCVQSALTKLPPPGVDDEISEASFPSERLEGTVWNFKDVQESASLDESELVILVFDEARASLDVFVHEISRFRLIRRAVARFAQSNRRRRFLAVFIDTSPSIVNVNISPSDGPNPSLRPSPLDDELMAQRLYLPFVLRNSFDVNFVSLKGNDLSSLVDSYDYLLAGRPLVTRPMSLYRVLNDQIPFLYRKLHGGRSARTRSGVVSEMLCRLGAFIHPQHPYATELVANHMATLLAMDSKGNKLVAFVAEPKLAIAAADTWDSESLFAKELAPALQDALMSGAVDQGSRAELVAQIIWLFAFDEAARKAGKSVGESIELERVLTQLLPIDSDIDVSKAIPKHLQGSKLACCQFVNVMDRFSARIHVQAAQRHCGICFSDSQRGVDLAFPLFLKDLSVLLVQVRNSAGMQYPNSKTRKACMQIRPEIVFLDDNFNTLEMKEMEANCVTVFMQVGAKIAIAALEQGSSSQPTLQIFGLGSRCLKPAVRSCLETLINERLNLRNFLRHQNRTREQAHPFPDFTHPVASAWPFVHEDSRDITHASSSEEVSDNESDLLDTDNQKDDICAQAVAGGITVKRLKEICKQYGLKTSGNKSILLQRVLSELPMRLSNKC